MQLFITSCQLRNDELIISEQRVLYQMQKVLRYQVWQVCVFQDTLSRYYCTLLVINKDHAIARIDTCEGLLNPERSIIVAIALPNKREKADLIVQKLSELWVKRIIWRQAYRSQLKLTMVSSRKFERRNSIALEAVEQSRWTQVPDIMVVSDVVHALESSTCFVADISDTVLQFTQIDGSSELYSLIIWPEGGLAPQDYLRFPQYQQLSLGKTVLRMETAAICGVRGLLHVGSI